MAPVPTSILRVDASLRWSDVDEASSEDVALACVEWLLAETNACYRQHCLASDAVRSVASTLRDNVVDSILAATLASELCVDSERFMTEMMPTAELRDRHAARSVPLRSPEKAGAPSSPARAAAAAVMAAIASSSTSSIQLPLRKIPKAMAEQTPARVRRRKRVEKDEIVKEVRAPMLPQLLDQCNEFSVEEESQDTKQWRIACLKELEASKKKPGFAKWAAVARAFTTAGNEPSSLEPDVTLGSQQQGQSSPKLGVLKLRSNVDSFSTICDVHRSPERQRSTTFGDMNNSTEASDVPTPTCTSALNPINASKAKRTANSAVKSQRGSVILNDKLSRQARPATTHGGASSSTSLQHFISNAGIHSSGGGLWKYERHNSSVPLIGSLSSSASVTPINEIAFDFATLANSPSALAPGVALARGEAVLEGPERVDSPNNMSKKRFDLHQRLTMDHLLNGTELSASSELMPLSPVASSSLTPTRGGDRTLVKNYVEEPAVPVQLPPSPNPLLPDALAIPRTHLAISRSVPSLRVRTPTSAARSPNDSNYMLESVRVGTDPPNLTRRQRPSTAMAPVAAATLTRLSKGSSSTTALVPTRSAYMREFPKPPKGVVIRATSTAAASTDEALRVAWSS